MAASPIHSRVKNTRVPLLTLERWPGIQCDASGASVEEQHRVAEVGNTPRVCITSSEGRFAGGLVTAVTGTETGANGKDRFVVGEWDPVSLLAGKLQNRSPSSGPALLSSAFRGTTACRRHRMPVGYRGVRQCMRVVRHRVYRMYFALLAGNGVR